MDTDNIFKIDCVDKCKRLWELESVLNKFLSENKGTYSSWTPFERDVLEKLGEVVNNKYVGVDEVERNLRKFFSERLFHFWKMTKSTIKNGYTYETIRYIYPYKVNDINNCLFCLATGDLNEDFSASISDTGFLLSDFMDGDTVIRLEEVTREDFENANKNNIKKIIDERLAKVNGEIKTPQYNAVWVDDKEDNK